MLSVRHGWDRIEALGKTYDLKTPQEKDAVFAVRHYGFPHDYRIEADPAVVDVDGDGILDILIADHDFNLTAISGLATAGARRKLEARGERKPANGGH